MFLFVSILILVAGLATWAYRSATETERARQKALKRPAFAPAYDPQAGLYRASDGTITQVPRVGCGELVAYPYPAVSWRDNRDDYVAPASWVDPTPSYASSPSYSSSCDTSSYSDSSSSSDCGSSSCSCD